MEESFSARSGHSIAPCGPDHVVCVGGYDGERRLSEVWRLGCEYEQEKLTLRGAELVGRAGHCMIRVGEQSYAVGLGYDTNDKLLGDVVQITVLEQEATVETLCTEGGMARRWACCGATPDGQLLVWGGWSEKGPLRDCALFDPMRRRWSPPLVLEGAPRARRWAACDMVGGRLLVAGGYDGAVEPLGDAFAIDIRAGRVATLPWQLPRSRHTLCNGFLVGGYGPRDAVQRTVFRADSLQPLARAESSPYECERAGHAACALDAERTLLVGGFVGAQKPKLSADVAVVRLLA
jgi:hypothetical protein